METTRCRYVGGVDIEDVQMETFVVFDLPSLALVVVLLPRDVLWNGEERLLLLALDALHDGGDKLLQKAIYLQQRGPEVVEEINQQPLDVRPIVILICHDHQMSVSQLRHVCVLLAKC